MIKDEREMIVCCAQILLGLPALPATRKQLGLVASALCTFAVADEAEREFICDGQYRDIEDIEALMNQSGGRLADAGRWVEDIGARPRLRKRIVALREEIEALQKEIEELRGVVQA